MHLLSAHPSVSSSMPNDSDRRNCHTIDMNYLYYTLEQLADERCQKGQTGDRVEEEG